MKERRRKDAAEGEEGDEGGREDGGGEDDDDDGRVLGVFVHRADYLPIGDHNLLHPNVKVRHCRKDRIEGARDPDLDLAKGV